MAEYIYYIKGRGYHVMKRIDGKHTSFGYYPKLSSAEFVRDELAKVNWDKKYLKNIQRRMVLWKK